MTELKIAYIGGGSRDWARDLMNDLALCPDFSGEIRLYDINLEAARQNEKLGNWLQSQPGVCSHWRYRAVERLDQALPGADFVFISIQPGPLEEMAREIALAEKYGMFFPVGDTTGVPGLMRGLRAAMDFAGFAEAIDAHAPEAWVFNYSNPMAICTSTLTRRTPDLKVIGCCHEVFGAQQLLAEVAQKALDLPGPPSRDEVNVNVLGVNHFTWIDRADYQGHDLLALLREQIQQPGVRRFYTPEEVIAQGDFFADNRQVKYALFERFGILPAAGDRHLVEFLPGFTRSPEELFKWGVIRTPVSYRIERRSQSPDAVKDYLSGRVSWNMTPSGEEITHQLRALAGLGDIVTNVNTANRGQVAGLPRGAAVETNAVIRRDRVAPLASGALPGGLEELVRLHAENEEMIVTAALERDRELAFQAVWNDPANPLPLDEAWALFNEIGVPWEKKAEAG